MDFTHGTSHASNQNSEKGMYIGTYVAYTSYGCFLNADSKYGGCYDYFHGSIYCVKKVRRYQKKKRLRSGFSKCVGPVTLFWELGMLTGPKMDDCT